MTEKKILLVLPHQNFHDEEYTAIKEGLEKHGLKTETASTHLSEAKGKFDLLVYPDFSINYVEAGDYAGFIFIGEEAAQEYYSNSDILRIVNDAHLTGKPLAAIGKAVPILAYTGKLTGLTVTSDESERGRLEELGAYFTGKDIESNHHFITASGPGNAKELAQEFIQELNIETTDYLR